MGLLTGSAWYMVAVLAGISLLSLFIYRALLHPLRTVPGPLICRLTSLWTYYHSFVGDECQTIDRLHAKYGPVLRIGPNEVIISDGNALAPIYTHKGGFLKAACYQNFDIGGHATIFSALDPDHRAIRSKAVLPLFSTTNIRAGNEIIEACAKKYIGRFREESRRSRASQSASGQSLPVNVHNLSRSFALDAMSSYLFGRPYGGLDESGEVLSASSFVDVLVAVGRYFYLPKWAFVLLEESRQKFWSSTEEIVSAMKVDHYVQDLVDESKKGESTYQSRLKKADLATDENKIQCEDLIFAGTDSTGMNLSTICWNLAKQPQTYTKLCSEVADADAKGSPYNPQSLPYLDAIIREGLRVSMANPSRMPRVVPSSGFHFTANDGKSYFFPPRTLVGSQMHSLHFNSSVFSDPQAFKPDRWLDSPTPEMQRDFIPFGLGPRQCIARNLAMQELFVAVRAIARARVLDGANAVGESIEKMEWFNSKVKSGRIDLVWD